ncbi:MAG: hypothetical protein PWQ42_148 [Sulfurospirillum sp.]|jgi:hypothetical protein|nr:hypothetical protein [Sulfurospirillum sp.]DAB32833.1 MAG TPA: hypothetical protein CFH79_01725 [Sulfurospirillum sp. UBA11407]
MSLKKLKIFFLSFFRELFVYHHTSLEFRAKLFAAMIASNKNDNSCEYKVLSKIASEIYDDEYRVNVLVHTTKEYVNKILKSDSLDLDCLLLDIDKDLKRHKRFKNKINMQHLRSFFTCNGDEDTSILQTRILEFFENELK